MLNRCPRALPELSVMLEDIGNPSPAEIGQALDVHPRTVQRWLSDGVAPRPAGLALWWLTRWGGSLLESEHARTLELLYLRATGAEREAAALRHELARVVALQGFGCANDPTLQAGPLPAQRLHAVSLR